MKAACGSFRTRPPKGGCHWPETLYRSSWPDIEELGAILLPIERADILASVELPPHHGDPFDRLYVAQAQLRNLVLVSKDDEIAKYDVTVLWK